MKSFRMNMLLALAGAAPLVAWSGVSADCCGGNQGSYTLTVTVDGVTVSTGGEHSGTPATLQPSQELTVNWTLTRNGGDYGENPHVICNLDETTLFNEQESPGGGSFPFYAPSTPGTYSFGCAISDAPGGDTPTVELTVE